MSTFEAYDDASQHYDSSRDAVGLEVVLGCLSRGSRPLHEQSLLDAGCGTGNYCRALADRLGRVTGLDMSAGMLAVAGRKLAAALAEDRVALRTGSITAMPFEAESFDALLFNQVLHHLEDGRDPAYGGHGAAIAEAWRVLRPGGSLLINASLHPQLRHGYWAYHLAPRALEAVLRRCAPLERFRALLSDQGFLWRERFVPLDAVLQGESYFDPRGPMDEGWRKGDSFWALVEEDELAAALAELRRLEGEAGLTAYRDREDAERPLHGQFTVIWAVKP